MSDITLGDFWGIEKTHSEFGDNIGTSLVIIRTQKGQKVFSKITERIRLIETDLEKALIYNTSMLCSAERNPDRDSFLNELNNEQVDLLLKKYCKESFKMQMVRIAKRIIKRL